MKTKIKTTASIKSTIKKLNAAFKKATPAERRVMVAKDAMEQIKARRFVASSGVFTDVDLRGGASLSQDEPLQPLLHSRGTTCYCCGVGAIFLSYVRLNNKATDKDGHDFWDIVRTTKWPEDNLKLIELAFERGRGVCRVSIDEPADQVAARAFENTLQEHGSDARLVAILKNIVRNKGLFQP